jgi:5,10-methylenetetrahydromethanopterin reductase
MKIGLFGGNIRRGQGLGDVVEDVVQAEKAGFASYWFPQVGTYDSLTLIALAGQRTERIAFGTAVVPSYPRHPSALAQQAATVNALTGGRLTLGVGPSHDMAIRALGLAYERPARHMREYVTVLKALTTEGRVDFQGEMYKVRTGFMIPGAEPFPIVISALAPLMLKAAGEVADGTVTWMVGHNTIANHTVPRIKRAAEAAGRPEPRVIVGLPVCVHDDPAEATAQAVKAFQGYSGLPNYRRQLDAEGLAEAGEIAVTGPENAVTDALAAYFDAGATEIIASVYTAGENRAGSAERTLGLLAELANG